MSNRLKQEKSPYLQQHKDNPVDWFPWGPEAFRKAESEQKPVFLSIGYSTCHWCHVMAQESFEDPGIAALLEDFVCIKVDREERPDIDAVYMAVCQSLTGSGGWPLTIFMTPQQKPFFAGTYFPKTSRYGQAGLTQLLKQISHLWKTEREKLTASGEQIAYALQKAQAAAEGEPEPALLYQGCRLLRQSFDPKWGGFGAAPKFPTPHNLLFLMRMYEQERDPDMLEMAETTLKAMALGGIFDQIGGGFSRYSTDKMWLVPHFEKMLYDNALLILAYLEAFQITKNPFYAGIARRTADYILEELTDQDGGFFCGQDADSGGVEGKYYVFTPDEIRSVLGRADGEEFCRIYGITQEGNFEGKSIPNRIGRKNEGWEADDPRLTRLKDYRKARVRLHLDHKILLSWNGWAIAALARAGRILGESRYAQAAGKAVSFIRGRMTDEKDRLYLRWCDGEAAYAGQLDDYAVYTLALIELYQATFEIGYLREAVRRGEQMILLFEEKSGGYVMTSHDAEKLIAPMKETYDGAIPSGNSAAQMALEMLAGLTGEATFREAANRQHRFMAGQIRNYPAAHCFSLAAMMLPLYPHRELLIAAKRLPEAAVLDLREHPAHNLCILFKSEGSQDTLSQTAPFTKSYPLSQTPLYYLCENGVCHAPVGEWEELSL